MISLLRRLSVRLVLLSFFFEGTVVGSVDTFLNCLTTSENVQ